jgi:hypothetical protein
MAALPMTWGIKTLPMPAVDGITVERAEYLGRQARMADGSLRADFVAEKHTVSVSWVDLTLQEYSDLMSAYTTYRTTAATLELPDETAMTVLPKYGSFSASEYYDRNGDGYYSVRLVFLEV